MRSEQSAICMYISEAGCLISGISVRILEEFHFHLQHSDQILKITKVTWKEGHIDDTSLVFFNFSNLNFAILSANKALERLLGWI